MSAVSNSDPPTMDLPACGVCRLATGGACACGELRGCAVATTYANGDPRTTHVSLHDAIETLCYDYLSQTHGAWENNDGAYGMFRFDVSNRSIHLDFNERFTDTNEHSHDF